VRRLEDPELDAYDLIPAELAARVRIRRAVMLPRSVDAVTFGRTVWLRRDHDRSGRRELLAHELVHVRQYTERGRLRFLAGYLGCYLQRLARLRSHRAAYLEIPAEIEARRQAAAWARRRSAGNGGPKR